MNTQEQNLQILAEHIVNIDTTAEHITAVNSVADIVVQLVAVAGMLPDIAGTIAMRGTLTSVAKKLSAVQNVADAMPLLEAVRGMESDIRAALGVRTEMASVVAHLDAVRSLAAQLDVLLQLPQHAADAKTAAEAATEASSQINSQLSKAETARLGAELAENKAKVTADLAAESCAKAATSAGEAQQAADAAAAVSGLPDASAAAPGDPLIWNGSKFAVGTLDDTLQSVAGALGLAAPVLNAIETAQHTADGVEAKVTQAVADAASAKTTAEGVDAKATQALSNAASAQELAQSARAEVTAFSGRLSATESETLRLGEAQNAHAASGDMHHSTAALVERINAAVSAGLAELRDNSTGTLPETHNTLQKLAWLLDAARETVDGFLFGENATDRTAMLNAIEANRAAIATLQGDLLLKSDLVDSLDIPSADRALSANQGTVLLGMVNRAQMTADSASVPWVKTLGAVPAAWPNDLNPKGLLLICPEAAGDSEGSPLVNPEWYVNVRNIPERLTLDASGIRLADGTTVQSGVASTLTAAQAAQTAATGAQTAATEAKTDAASAKTTAEGVDGKATQAQTEATEAKTEAASAKAIAEAIDAKATQAQTDAAAAKTTAEGVDAKADSAIAKATQALADAAEALAKSPDLATQTTPGIVKGSDTVTVDNEGALHAASGVTVVSPPTVTVPSQIALTYPFDIKIVAGPVLLSETSVVSFEVSVDGRAPVTVAATNGSATLSHTTQGNLGDVLVINVVAVDSIGNRSVHSTVQTVVVEVIVDKPQILVPETGSYHFKNGILIAASPFSASAGGHAASKFEIEDDEGSIVYSIEESGAQTTHTVAGQHLIPGKTYSIFVSYRGVSGAWSPRSDAARISIRDSVLMGGGSADGVNQTGFLTTSPWPGGKWQNAVFASPVESGQGGPILFCVFGKGKILLSVSSGGTGGVSLSEDGVHFTAPRRIGTLQAGRDNTDVLQWRGIGYGNGIYTACGGAGKTTWSNDGLTWETPIAVDGQSGFWRCMGYGNNRYVVCGESGKVASSPDMVHWTPASVIPGMAGTINGVKFVKNMFIACGDAGKYATSEDGIVWTQAVQIAGAGNLLDCASDGNSIVMLSTNAKNFISTDGATWNASYATGASIVRANMSFFNGKFHFPGSTKGIMLSDNGKTWTPATPQESSRYYYMTFAI